MLFDEQELQKELAKSISSCKSSVIVLSAFIKKSAFEWFISQFRDTNIGVTIVARWTLSDLLSGISDLEVYELCKSKGWTFKIDQRNHSKVYLIDSSYALVGSSNLTGSGLGLHTKSNFELSMKGEVSDIDLNKVNKYMESCVTVTDDIYEEIAKVYNSSEKVKIPNNIKWPDSVKQLLETDVNHLWVDDLFFTDPLDENPKNEYFLHDLSLLGINSKNDVDIVNSNQVRAINWLKCQLIKEESKSLKFGAVSKRLHNALLNDPKPYRKDVKELQGYLYKWIKNLELSEFEFQKYNISETVFLNEY